MSVLEFSVADVPFKIESNMQLSMPKPEACNLHTNFRIASSHRRSTPSIFDIQESSEDLALERRGEHLVQLRGDITRAQEECGNAQFSLFGNKGPISRFILHSLELRGVVSLHACALLEVQTRRLVLGIGPSGAGKSALVSAALSAGWELISTEYTHLSKEGVIWLGNAFDNVSPVAGSYMAAALPDTRIFPSSRLCEPIGEKIMIDISNYSSRFSTIDSGRFRLTIVHLRAGDGRFKRGKSIQDKDFALRCLQSAAAEQISAPSVFFNSFFPSVLCGDHLAREHIVLRLLRKAESHFILGGEHSDFINWFRSAGYCDDTLD